MYIIYMMHIKYIHRLLGVLKSIHLHLLTTTILFRVEPKPLIFISPTNSQLRSTLQLLIQRAGVGRAEDPLARLTIHLFRKAYGVA